MNPFSALGSLGRRLFRRSELERDLQDEMRDHVARRIEDLERAGLTPAEAARCARMEFGSNERFKAECRDAMGGRWLDAFLQDLRFSVRMLRKSPGFTTVALLTMALGLGATTAIFSVVDAALLRPLPYPHPEELVRIEADLPGINARDVGMSEPEWQDLQQSGIFTNVSPAWFDDNNLTGSSRPARVSLLSVAPNYFELLGKSAALGRTFPPTDHSPSFTGEVVISDGLWKRTFGGDPNILGRNIRMDTDLYQIVGVMPPDFHNPGRSGRERNIEIWAATSFYGPPMPDHPSRSGRNLPTAVARLHSGLTIKAAQERVNALVDHLHAQFPQDYPGQMGWKIRLVPLKETVVGNVRQPLVILLSAAGLVLLIGCVNIANLLLARASVRAREMAIRHALGAGSGRLACQLLTESILLALCGGACGLFILFVAEDFLLRLVPDSLPRFGEISVNAPVLAFAFAASILCGIAFGLAPALQLQHGDLGRTLNQEGRGTTSAGGRARTRRLLVVTEFAFSLVLMIAAGLLLHSFWDLLNTRLGFDPEGVTAIKTRLPYPNDVNIDQYKTPAQQSIFFREIMRRCQKIQGVKQVALGDLGALPLAHDRTDQNPPVPMTIEGRVSESTEAPLVDESIVSPGYFQLMGISLLRGRFFSELDTDGTEPVVIINQALAKAWWPNENPIGQHVRLTRKGETWSTIIGVVADARTESLENSDVPQIYTNAYQRGAKHLVVFLRGSFDPGSIAEQVRPQIQSVDPTLPVFSSQPLSETVADFLAQRRFVMQMVGLFAVAALLLAGLGIYGVISYIVSERTKEIGIRLALGAASRRILGMVLAQGLRLALVGAVAGLGVAVIVCRSMASLLYGISPFDPVTFIGVTLLFLGLALLACYLPARRATRIDPAVALRAE